MLPALLSGQAKRFCRDMLDALFFHPFSPAANLAHALSPLDRRSGRFQIDQSLDENRRFSNGVPTLEPIVKLEIEDRLTQLVVPQ
jgi:hypothetical protein